jgi:Tol biopolymer transport system component
MIIRQVWATAPLGLNATAISPDGRYLVYAGPGQDRPEGTVLYVRDLSGGLSRPLTPADSAGFIVSAVFSPDSRVVGLTWYNGVRDDLREIMLDGSTGTRIPYRSDEWPHLAMVAWSRDGQQMLMALKSGPRARQTRHIGVMSVQDGSIRILETLGMQHFPSLGGFSIDGRYIIYDSPALGDSGERDIVILGTGGARPVRLVSRAADDHNPYFTPDGRGVLFFSGGAGEPVSAWYQRVADGNPQGSPELLRQDMGPTAKPIGFSSNGSFYYHIHSDSLNMRAVWVMEDFLPGDPAR